VAIGKRMVSEKDREEDNPFTSCTVEKCHIKVNPSFKPIKEELEEKEGDWGGNWKIAGHFLRFKDNTGIDYRERELKLARRIGVFWLYPQWGSYRVEDNGQKGEGKWVGGGVRYKSVKVESYRKGIKTTYQLEPFQFSYTRYGMVYSRRNYCSIHRKRHKWEVSYYSQLEKGRDLWWSMALEKVDDGNWVFTPQFDLDFPPFHPIRRLTLTPNISGWYQFNKKTTKCYYSPHFVDSTIAHLKWKYDLIGNLKLTGKIGVGWSFKDGVLLKDGAIYLQYPPFGFKMGCEYDHTTSRSGKPYESRECILRFEKVW